jgi:hypothetical protein
MVPRPEFPDRDCPLNDFEIPLAEDDVVGPHGVLEQLTRYGSWKFDVADADRLCPRCEI